MLFRLILLALGVWLILTLLRQYRRSIDAPPAPPAPQDMVRCAKCGVHLPRGESLARDGRYYCCADHRDHPQP